MYNYSHKKHMHIIYKSIPKIITRYAFMTINK